MKKQHIVYIILFMLITSAILYYFNFSYSKNRFSGFPLDDTWIFFGYARTFINTGVFSINQNTPPSAGITSPLYVLFISFAFILGFNSEFLFVLIFNTLALFFASVFLLKLILKITENYLFSLLLTAIFIFDFRTISIANSGMETILFVLVEILALYFIFTDKKRSVFLTLGIGFWIRPEIILLFLVYSLFYLKNIKIKDTFLFFIPLLFYFGFMKIFSGNLIPQTGKAKSLFFSYINKLEFLRESFYYFVNFGFPLIMILFFISLLLIKKRNKFQLILIAYFITFYLFFLFYLPILYNFGRYLYPLFPIILLISSYLIKYINQKFKILNYLIFLIIIIFSIKNYSKGKIIYAYKVHQFMSRHIVIANWINNNTPPKSIIATHDIGAIGYLTQRQIVDLVGLIEKGSIGISDKPKRLKEFLLKRNVQYIAVLNSWFKVYGSPLLFETSKNKEPKFQIYKFTKNTEIIRVDLLRKSEK